MTIQLGKYNFEGLFDDPTPLRRQSGVYAILGGDGSRPWLVVDIGEAENVQLRVERHERSECWMLQGHVRLGYAAYYCNARERVRIERSLRARYRPPCCDG